MFLKCVYRVNCQFVLGLVVYGHFWVPTPSPDSLQPCSYLTSPWPKERTGRARGNLLQNWEWVPHIKVTWVDPHLNVSSQLNSRYTGLHGCCVLYSRHSKSLIFLSFFFYCSPVCPQTQKSSYPCLPTAGIKGVCHKCLARLFNSNGVFLDISFISCYLIDL